MQDSTGLVPAARGRPWVPKSVHAALDFKPAQESLQPVEPVGPTAQDTKLYRRRHWASAPVGSGSRSGNSGPSRRQSATMRSAV
jgi:hypothetical protein